MILCEVVGRVWPESPLAGLNQKALVTVRDIHSGALQVALDLAGAGTGARVLVVVGEPARVIADGAPVDAVVTAIVAADSV